MRPASKLILLGVVFVAGTAAMDAQSGMTVARWQHIPLRMLLNTMPGLLLAALLLALTRRAVLAVVLALLIEALLYGINALKMANLGTPLLPVDFYMVGELSHGASKLFGGYLPRSIWPYLAIAGVLTTGGLLARYEPPLLMRRQRLLRASLAASSVLVLATLLAGMWPWPQVYNPGRMHMQPWSPAATTRDAGLVNSLLLFHLHYGVHAEKPDMASVRRLLAQQRPALTQYMQQPVAAGPRPDIVVVQSESFFDPVIMNGFQNAGWNPNLHQLAQRGTSGLMHVPTFGGGTIRTEFEVLTGMPLRYLNGVQFPYLQIDQPVIPSLVRTLHEHGYQTTAVHGANPEVWDRARAFRKMGFDRFVSRADFPVDAPTDGRYMADNAMTKEILKQLDQVDDRAPPQFIFAISIEAHGSYDVSPGIDPRVRDAIAVPADVTDPEAKLELRDYLYHMRHADEELGRLVMTLAKRSRPTIVVFYGDHLPGLIPAYKQAGFVDGGDYQTQMVPWLMLETHNPQPARHKNTAAWMLPGMILERAGIHDTPYFALTQLVGQPLVAFTHADGPRQDVIAGATEKTLDAGMANLTKLRLRGSTNTLTVPTEENRGLVDQNRRINSGLTRYGRTSSPGIIGYGASPP